MDQSSISQTAAVVVVATLLVVAGFSFLAHVGLEYRAELARRIDSLLHDARRPTGSSKARIVAPHRAPERRAFALPPRDQNELERRFAGLGISSRWVNVAFFCGRLVLAAVAAVGLTMVGSHLLGGLPAFLRIFICAVFGALLGAYLPLVVLRALARRRVEAVEHGLADAIELLVVSVEAGIALEDGIDRIAVELRRSQRALADELADVAADLKLLPSQREALMNFADRIDRASVRSVMTTLAQTMEYGTPLAQALRVTSAELRNELMLKLEERVNRLPVLLTIPMVVFLLPAIFLVVGGPAILRLVDTLFR